MTRLRRRLPRDWSVARLTEGTLFEVTWRRCHAVCLVLSETGNPSAAVKAKAFERQTDGVSLPAVVLLSDLTPTGVIGLGSHNARRVLIDSPDVWHLKHILWEMAVRPTVEHVRATVRLGLAQSPLLASILAKVVGQVAEHQPDTLGVRHGSVTFCRRVKDLPSLVGMSRSHVHELARRAEVPLAEFLRRNAVLHGMVLSGPDASGVPYRLGFRSRDAWRLAVRRSLGCGFPKARQHELGYYGRRVLELIGCEME